MSTTQPITAVALTPADAERPRTGLGVSRLRSCLTLYQLTLRQYLHGRRWLALTLLFLLPAGLTLLIRMSRAQVPNTFLEFVMSWMLVPQALLPLSALLYSSGIIQDEQEDQTITYLLMRPISKWTIYAVKMLATWTTMIVLVIVLVTLTFAAVYAKSDIPFSDYFYRAVKATAILSLAGITYCSLFGLIGLLTKRILMFGIVYIAVVEGVFASLPLSLRMGTVIYYTRLLAYRTLDFKVSWMQRSETDVAATAWNLDTVADPKLAEHPQISSCIWTLVIASIVCVVLAGFVCSRREFHVKTPEAE
jgi:ABC-2 type transport system permease protein